MSAGGLIIAAPSSGSGKTLVTLGLIRHLSRAGHHVASAKVGPDYIDPAFHTAAGSRNCETLDGWAMRRESLAASLARLKDAADFIVCEGVMGLFDGAEGGGGATADIAALTGWPVVLVVDVRGMAASIAALVGGFARFRDDIRLAGVIFNRVASDRHLAMLTEAVRQGCSEVAVLGGVRRDEGLVVPSRHLGLVQAGERADLDGLLDAAAKAVGEGIDMTVLKALATPPGQEDVTGSGPAIPPLGQRIAVASDIAFAFNYPHLLDGWRSAGAELSFFSPLAGEGPGEDADAVYLPGGYPELHAGRLAASEGFLDGMRAVADRGAAIYGECGGFMVLGEDLVDSEGIAHRMCGLLPLATSFEKPARHLGYRRIEALASTPLGPAGSLFRGHEFHYSTCIRGDGTPLFRAADATGRDLGPTGMVAGRVAGSYLHLIDRADTGT
jgi:cobyrinic acid a,c-diamide synthase